MSGLSAPPSEYTYRVSGHNTMIKLADGKVGGLNGIHIDRKARD